MRFLHTADWHLGKILHGHSRAVEQEQVLAEILEIARREKIDCVLVAGDLFESQAPPPEAERLVYNFFAELLSARIAAVVIGGNHDHPRRLAAARELLDPLHIHVRPEPARPHEGGVVTLERGGEQARIAVLPFVTERKIVGYCQMMAPEDTWYATYADKVARMCAVLAESFSSSAVNLFLAHLSLFGAEASGTERAIHLGQPYSVSAPRLPGGAHYIALGHLHRPQEIPAPSPCFYAGSPIQLDFGELGQAKRVVVIEAHPGRPAHCESVPLISGRSLRAVRGTLPELEALRDEVASDLLRVTLVTDGPLPGAAELLRLRLPNALDVHLDYPRAAQSQEQAPRSQLPPEELFAEFIRRRDGAPPAQQLREAFRELSYEVARAAG